LKIIKKNKTLMKNTLFLPVLAVLLIFGCGKPNPNSTQSAFPSKAETKPQYDQTSFGVYKGVIIGSSGFILFRINNGDNIVKGYLTIDDKKDTLSTTQTLVAGKPIVDLKFTGKFSSMVLNAEADGNSAEVTDIKIEGHPGNVAGIVVHENSTQQVFCYEGKFSGNQTGTFNCTKIGAGRGDSTEGFVSLYFAAKFALDTLYTGGGYLYHNEVEARIYNPSNWRSEFYIQGKFNNDNFTGTWDFSEVYGKGTFSCVRTY
jgi:hypothetical protein